MITAVTIETRDKREDVKKRLGVSAEQVFDQNLTLVYVGPTYLNLVHLRLLMY